MIQSNRQSVCVGICSCHTPSPIPMTGRLLTTSSDFLAGASGAGRMTDIIIGYCGHTGTIISGSSKSFINGLPAARVGDRFSGCFTGTIITGKNTLLIG